MASLYIVATPIGNLGDVTLRALDVLRGVDVIFSEDTRVTRRLLDRYEIKVPLQSLNARTEMAKSGAVIKLLSEGKNVALVTDAGTPGISDPGRFLVNAVRTDLPGVAVMPLPGPSALTAAVSASGLACDEFVFYGFLPHKKGRLTKLKEIIDSKRTSALYESPHRIMKLLDFLAKNAAERQIFVAREITKIHEESLRGTAIEMFEYYKSNPDKVRGEFVVIVSPK